MLICEVAYVGVTKTPVSGRFKSGVSVPTDATGCGCQIGEVFGQWSGLSEKQSVGNPTSVTAWTGIRAFLFVIFLSAGLS